MPKALIVSSVFPPLGSAGASIRLVKFLKYLSALDWQFVVFTQDIQRPIVQEQVLSSFLLDDLPPNLEVIRIPAPFSSYQSNIQSDLYKRGFLKFFQRIFGDSALPWGLRVLWNGLRSVHQSKIDIVFGTAPPFTNALIAMLLGWISHKPFVLDLRDDWVGPPVFRRKNPWRQKIEMRLEHLIIGKAAAVITVTPDSYKLYKERYAHLQNPEKFHLVPNGCDLAEYDALKNREKRIVSDRFLILSAAWWYQKKHRDISPFLFGLNRFLQRRPDASKKLEVVLLGHSLSSEYDQLLLDLNLSKIINKVDSVGRTELLDWLWKADLFLLIQPVNNTTAISGTLYEYWATGKAPILLISEMGASSDLVENNQLGKHLYFDQVEQIADYVENIFDAYQSKQAIWINRDGIQKFDRMNLAKVMNDIWKSLLPAAKQLQKTD